MSAIALQERPGAARGESDRLEVALGSRETPIGVLHLAATAQGVVRIGFGSQEALDDMAVELGFGPGSDGAGDPAWLEEPARQLDQYFTGTRRRFDLALDRRFSHGFYRRVLDTLIGVAYGTTVSYGELARLAGAPRAARAVGTAMSTNPIPLIVPCHRVVRSDGSVGEYGGRPEVKSWLLEHERSHLGS
ncbi:methylated-DNA--[protein]-cysteine S-methyltransferase [Candidatus Poriferisocius sp.]|uniref:methylated-DNA--[protein]-cysteine S-methyltransferase n=1 Tax=Candidatus Poriferisocius sp. TaxID=3101276 RepID=UPI003B5CF444